ncbi:MAG: response regulator, partial [Mycobacteriales bacterium]
MVADDSRVMRQIIIRTLRQAGYDWDITEAADGDLALEIVTKERPDLVLSDWNMPDMDGLAFVTAVRARHDWRGLTLMMVTTEAEHGQ